jgi:hypothetical protein
MAENKRKQSRAQIRDCGIYLIKSRISGGFYIGSSINLRRRKFAHFSALHKRTHSNPHMQASYDIYGSDAFTFEILLYCDSFNVELYENMLSKFCMEHGLNRCSMYEVVRGNRPHHKGWTVQYAQKSSRY